MLFSSHILIILSSEHEIIFPFKQYNIFLNNVFSCLKLITWFIWYKKSSFKIPFSFFLIHILISFEQVAKLFSSFILQSKILFKCAFVIFWIILNLLLYIFIVLSAETEIIFPEGNCDIEYIISSLLCGLSEFISFKLQWVNWIFFCYVDFLIFEFYFHLLNH